MSRRAALLADISQHGLHKGEGGLISTRGRSLNWLIDLRAVFMRPDTLVAVADEFWSLYQDRACFQVGGMETAAIPLLTAILLRAPERIGASTAS